MINVIILDGQNKMAVRRYGLGDWLSIKNFNFVTSLSESQNFVFFGTTGGILSYNKDQFFEEPAYTVSDGLADDHITALYWDHSTSFLWAAHRKGVSFLSPSDDSFQNVYFFENGQGLVRQIGSNGENIWLRFHSGDVLKLNSQSGNKEWIAESDNQENINWSLSKNNEPVELVGIYDINPGYVIYDNGKVMDHEFREYYLNFIYVDNRRDIYGGIYGLGYVTGSENIKKINFHHSGILKTYVNALAIGERFMWTGSIDNEKQNELDKTGISEFDFKEQTWKYYEDYDIHELATGCVFDPVISENQLFAGTCEGLSIYDLKKNKWKRISIFDGLYDNEVKTISVSDTIALVGTDFGLNEINLKDYNVFRLPLTKMKRLLRINKILKWENYFWIGTNNGIYSIDITDRSILHYDDFGKNINLDKNIAMECVSIASYGDKVVFKGNNHFMRYHGSTKKWENLPNYDFDATVFDMDMDGDFLWIGTNEGAKLLNVQTGEWEKYSHVDGLAGDIVMKVVIDGDWVWFGTNKGLTKYNWRKYVFEK